MASDPVSRGTRSERLANYILPSAETAKKFIMLEINRKVDLLRGKKPGNDSRLSQKRLEENGLQGIHLRAYQLDGVTWIRRCFRNGHGCILGDEMGLGKTVQV